MTESQKIAIKKGIRRYWKKVNAKVSSMHKPISIEIDDETLIKLIDKGIFKIVKA